jgi:hypothetical protein
MPHVHDIPPRPDTDTPRAKETAEKQAQAVRLMSEAIFLCHQHGLSPQKVFHLFIKEPKE